MGKKKRRRPAAIEAIEAVAARLPAAAVPNYASLVAALGVVGADGRTGNDEAVGALADLFEENDLPDLATAAARYLAAGCQPWYAAGSKTWTWYDWKHVWSAAGSAMTSAAVAALDRATVDLVTADLPAGAALPWSGARHVVTDLSRGVVTCRTYRGRAAAVLALVRVVAVVGRAPRTAFSARRDAKAAVGTLVAALDNGGMVVMDAAGGVHHSVDGRVPPP